MKQLLIIATLFLVTLKNVAQQFNASWITPDTSSNTKPNSWYCYRKTTELNKIDGSIIAKIATDTKYWLWINGKLIVYEGGLKRGPNPQDTYYDEVDIAQHLKKGKNSIALLVWFWGGKGFSHHNSGRSGLLFDCDAKNISLTSDESWKAITYQAYIPSTAPVPNFRLSEPSISYDANKEINNWMGENFDDSKWPSALVLGRPPLSPWNKLVKRNIPLFIFKEFQNYTSTKWKGDTLICTLPYNGQFSPYLKIAAKGDENIFICSDTYYLGTYPGDTLNTISSEYITKKGIQEYESLGWLSGHEIRYVIPKTVRVKSVQFRETGYASALAGAFESSDTFLNKLYTKAQRTLYVNMRDNYMDCPDRERAQWAGDAATEVGQTYYALDRNSDQLSRKLFFDLVNWQREDSTIYNPVPETNWKSELPVHSLMPMSESWRYFLFTKDTATLKLVYPALKKYLALWIIQNNGQLIYRKGGWDWGDWGDNKDFILIQHGWYLIATQTALKIAQLFQQNEDADYFLKRIELLKNFLNSTDCWNGQVYRHKDYMGETDDRANALMVLSGVADSTKYPLLTHLFTRSMYASPWMEQFVLQSLIKMKQPGMALSRMKLRYKDMVENRLTTLWEIWDHKDGEVHGNSGYNHGWSGGPLILLASYFAGINPNPAVENSWVIQPDLAGLKSIKIIVPVKQGLLKLDHAMNESSLSLKVDLPEAVMASIAVPKAIYRINQLLCNGVNAKELRSVQFIKEDQKYYWFQCETGVYNFKASW